MMARTKEVHRKAGYTTATVPLPDDQRSTSDDRLTEESIHELLGATVSPEPVARQRRSWPRRPDKPGARDHAHRIPGEATAGQPENLAVSQIKNREPLLPTGYLGAQDHLSEALADRRNASHAQSGWRGRVVGVGWKYRKSPARNSPRSGLWSAAKDSSAKAKELGLGA
jgi:hypothetical protein